MDFAEIFYFKSILPPSHQILYSFLFEMSHPILYITKLTKNSRWVPPRPNFSSLFTLLLLPYHTTFTPLSPFYTLKINRSHHFTHFSLSFSLLYTYFLTFEPKPNVNNWLGRREYKLMGSFCITNSSINFATYYLRGVDWTSSVS